MFKNSDDIAEISENNLKNSSMQVWHVKHLSFYFRILIGKQAKKLYNSLLSGRCVIIFKSLSSKSLMHASICQNLIFNFNSLVSLFVFILRFLSFIQGTLLSNFKINVELLIMGDYKPEHIFSFICINLHTCCSWSGGKGQNATSWGTTTEIKCFTQKKTQ